MPSTIPIAARSHELPCELSAVRALCQQARQFFAETGLSETELEGWELALAEALNNAVKYCRAETQELPIRLDLLVAPEWVEARITDHTPGFDWPEQASLPPDDRESGRGIFLIQNLTDHSTYLRGRDENCLVLHKRREPAKSLPSPATSSPAEELREALRTLDLMTEELASAYECLSTIFRFSSELQGGIASKEFIQGWLEHLAGITEAEWLVLRLCDRSPGHLRLAAIASTQGHCEVTRPEIALSEADCIEARAASARSDVWFDAGAPLAADDPLKERAGDGSGFAHPLVVNDVLVGVLTAGRHNGTRPFAAGHVSVIHTFGDFLGLQMRSSRMQEEQVQARLNTRDLEIAAGLQHALLPAHLPSLPRASLACFYRSARQVGGDYYDALPVGEGQMLLAVADVMGKGLPAALFAFVFRSLVRSRLDLASRPGELLEWLNRHLFQELDRAEMFVTAQLSLLDCHRGEIRVAGAGHPPLLVANAVGEVTEIASCGPPLGIFLGASFPEVCHPWPVGTVLMFTDGLIEARCPQGELLGMEAVKKILAVGARCGESSGATQQRLARLVEEFEQSSAPTDDTAFIVITRTLTD